MINISLDYTSGMASSTARTRKRKTPCGSSGGLLSTSDRTVDSKRSASEESSDCLLPNQTSDNGQQLNCSAESVSDVASVGSLAVSSSVSASSSATSIKCATCSENAVSQSEFTNLPNDIGSLFKPSMSTTDIVSIVSSLNQEQKYNLLKSHFVPSDMFSFPKEYSAGCNRCFHVKWLKQYPWLVYSKALDCGFCVFCALFVKDRSKYGVLVNKPFKKWVKVHKIVGGHYQTSITLML